jgi:hypothetical protein
MAHQKANVLLLFGPHSGHWIAALPAFRGRVVPLLSVVGL